MAKSVYLRESPRRAAATLFPPAVSSPQFGVPPRHAPGFKTNITEAEGVRLNVLSVQDEMQVRRADPKGIDELKFLDYPSYQCPAIDRSSFSLPLEIHKTKAAGSTTTTEQ